MSEQADAAPLLGESAIIAQDMDSLNSCELSVLAAQQVRTGNDLTEVLRSLGEWLEVIGALSREVELSIGEPNHSHERSLLRVASRITSDVRNVLGLLVRALSEGRFTQPKISVPPASVEQLLRAAVALRESDRAGNDGSLLFARAYELARDGTPEGPA